MEMMITMSYDEYNVLLKKVNISIRENLMHWKGTMKIIIKKWPIKNFLNYVGNIENWLLG